MRQTGLGGPQEWYFDDRRQTGLHAVEIRKIIGPVAIGVRREGVTEAAVKLQNAGPISYVRVRIEVLDRVGLEKRICECNCIVKMEYDRLLPMEITK